MHWQASSITRYSNLFLTISILSIPAIESVVHTSFARRSREFSWYLLSPPAYNPLLRIPNLPECSLQCTSLSSVADRLASHGSKLSACANREQ
jgi:hypothetical protein